LHWQEPVPHHTTWMRIQYRLENRGPAIQSTFMSTGSGTDQKHDSVAGQWVCTLLLASLVGQFPAADR